MIVGPNHYPPIMQSDRYCYWEWNDSRCAAVVQCLSALNRRELSTHPSFSRSGTNSFHEATAIGVKKADITDGYTDEELDLFVEGFLQANSDTPTWKETVRKFGKEEALQIIRESFKSSDTRKDRKKILVH